MNGDFPWMGGIHRGRLILEEMGSSRTMDIIYYPAINEYNGNRSLQLVVKDWKFC